MQYNVNKESISLSETLFEGCQEQAIDLDFSLPDYCPDIQKILKCQVCPRVINKNISADRLDVDGITMIRLLYVDAVKMCVRCCEQTIPFSNSFNLNESPQNAISFTKVKVEYVNCRALSPRRLDIHGAFSVCAKVIGKENLEIVSGSEELDVEEKKLTVKASNVVGIGQEQFSVEEVMQLNQGKPEIETIVREDVSVCLGGCKIVSNNLVIKGDVSVKVLYISDLENCNLDTMEYSIPISQIINVDGIDDDCICDVKLEVINYDISVKTDGSGDNNLISMDVKLVATAVAYNDFEVGLLYDAYSKTYDTDLEYKQVSIPRFIESINQIHIDKNSISTENNNISRIIDLWSDISSITSKVEDDKLKFIGKYNVCILAADEEDKISYIERMVDFENEMPWNDKPVNIKANKDLCILSMSYRLSGSGEIELRTEIKIDASIYDVVSYKFVNGIYVDEEKLRKKDTDAALTIYYADQGEDVWSIARKYCTSVDAIKTENELDGEVLENRKMLLIPMS